MKHKARPRRGRFFKRSADGKLLKKMADGHYCEVKEPLNSPGPAHRSMLMQLRGND